MVRQWSSDHQMQVNEVKPPQRCNILDVGTKFKQNDSEKSRLAEILKTVTNNSK